MYCKNLACPSQGRFTNRDVQVACNIVDRFIYAFVLGGTLGLLIGFFWRGCCYACIPLLILLCLFFFG
jgi:hypothetical protein